MINEITVYTCGIPIIILLIVSEIIYSYIYRLKYYKSKDSAAAFGLLFGNYVVNLGTKAQSYYYISTFIIIAFLLLMS